MNEQLDAEKTRLVLFLELLKKARDEGEISMKSYRAIWKAYHEAYSLCDTELV